MLSWSKVSNVTHDYEIDSLQMKNFSLREVRPEKTVQRRCDRVLFSGDLVLPVITFGFTEQGSHAKKGSS